ncbi:MAG: phospholipase [Luteitalea sp.]|nr:phospholipase [Luteitalea sp.]
MLLTVPHSATSVKTITTTTHGRYLVKQPVTTEPQVPAIVGFHGYGQHAESMLEELQRIADTDRWLLVSVQALHRFYTARHETVVASWMTRQDRDLAIEDNVRYIATVVRAIRNEWTINRLVYFGFSQGVAMAFRATAYAGHPADAIVALGGDIPPEIRQDMSVHIPQVLLGRGKSDDWYTESKLTDDVACLEARGVPHTVVRFDGGHEWTDGFRDVVSALLMRVARRDQRVGP